jgi:hypothetical protein
LEAITNQEDPAEDQVRNSMAMGLMLGIFRRTHDDLWSCGDCGDHGDLDATAPQHLLKDLLHAA